MERDERTALFNKNGEMNLQGISMHPSWIYNRENLPCRHTQMLEEDRYLIVTDWFYLLLSIADCAARKRARAVLIDRKKKEVISRQAVLAPMPGWSMPCESTSGAAVFKNREVDLRLENCESRHHIYCEWKKFTGRAPLKVDCWLDDGRPACLSMSSMHPESSAFSCREDHFNLHAQGRIVFNWHLYTLDPGKDRALLQWNRQGKAFQRERCLFSGMGTVKSRPFGFAFFEQPNGEAGHGRLACLYEGRLHIFEDVTLSRTARTVPPLCTMRSSNGKVDAVFTVQAIAQESAGLFIRPCTDQECLGVMNGKIILENGRTLWMEHLPAVLENSFRHAE